jgi:hypothetical protein
VSGPTSGFAAAAAASTSSAFVAITTRSQTPASAGSVVAWIRTVRPPLAPSTVSPRVRIASTCSAQASTAQTSLSASPRMPAYTDPIAPVPTIAIFIRRDPGPEP